MKKGICLQCERPRYVLSSGICMMCSYPTDSCKNCKNICKIRRNHLCGCCHEIYSVRIRIQEFESSINSLEQYPHYLFQLYLTYIQRNQLKHYHYKQAQQLFQILSEFTPEPILRWKQIFDLSKRFGPYSRFSGGCPWRKIGYMLQELGVLSAPVADLEPRLQTKLATIDPQTAQMISRFLDNLRRKLRKTNTLLCQVYYLKSLIDWAQSRDLTLLHMNPSLMKNYFDELHQRNPDPEHIRHHFFALNRFYRWCIHQKLIISGR